MRNGLIGRWTIGLLAVLGTSAAGAQGHGGGASLSPLAEPMALRTRALGECTRPISSPSGEAQAYFDQGFQLMYAFAKVDAARSFRAAQERDPSCAICYWGEAWAWGSYLNAPMREDEAPHAYAAIQRALRHAEQASEKERALIDAMAVRYVEHFDPAARDGQDMAYATAMRRVAERYPDDLDIATLYADALFLLEPRRGYRDIDDPDVRRIHAVLEGVLERDLTHPGACHLYVHATESTTRPEKALACAEFLGSSIPGASHINHMPSHTWNEVGRWGDSVRANIQAWHSDLKAASGGGFAIYPAHNLHMLLFSASMDGQGAIAMRAGKDYTQLTGDPLYEVLTLLRFGRFLEILSVAEKPAVGFSAGAWDFARGYAHLKRGETDFAQVYLERVREAAQQSEATFRWHSVSDLLGVAAGILEGEVHRAGGDLRAAVRSFERAVQLEDALTYDEPEPFPFAARHWLGAALLEAGRGREAERVYREELEDHPANGWSLFGLREALEAQGKVSSAEQEAFRASWARADTWIEASRF